MTGVKQRQQRGFQRAELTGRRPDRGAVILESPAVKDQVVIRFIKRRAVLLIKRFARQGERFALRPDKVGS